MDSFSMPLPRLLYLVYEMHSKGQITVSDKDRLKGERHTALIVTEDEQVMSLLDVYAENGDREALEKSVLALLKAQPRIKPPSPVAIPRREVAAPVEDEEEETSSPLGTFLHERKKHQHGEMELHLNLCQPAPDAQADSSEVPGLVNSS